MKRYILAVSGGVDSVVLLHMALKWPDSELVVAHFDHGIRSESADDAAFVAELARSYGVPFELGRGNLGNDASEELARSARYTFLRDLAKRHNAHIATAHHADDVIETMILNLRRGTGWRGLCSLRSGAIYRPFLHMRKTEILEYAKKHSLEWREDATNSEPYYTRNYIRLNIVPRLSDEAQDNLLRIYSEQSTLADAIDHDTETILQGNRGETPRSYRRHLFIVADQTASMELLQAMLRRETGSGVERPQLARALLAVKTFMPGKRFEVSKGVTLLFSRDQIIVESAENC